MRFIVFGTIIRCSRFADRAAGNYPPMDWARILDNPADELAPI